jgi:hypothetical protein
MKFKAHSQEQLKALNIQDKQKYYVEYIDKDYFNSEEKMEKTIATAHVNNGMVYFNIVDIYGMDKMIIQVKILGKA